MLVGCFDCSAGQCNLTEEEEEVEEKEKEEEEEEEEVEEVERNDVCWRLKWPGQWEPLGAYWCS